MKGLPLSTAIAAFAFLTWAGDTGQAAIIAFLIGYLLLKEEK